MAIVSITEAAELVGKSRRTIQRHLSQGKLSKSKDTTGRDGVDTSELIRVYGNIKSMTSHSDNSSQKSHVVMENNVIQTPNNSDENIEIKHLKEIIEMQKEHIDSLKKAMLLLEHKEESKKENHGWFSRLFNNSNK